MKIKEIEINNFKALGSTYKIDLTNSCKNLLIYGENGSGKSSLFQALHLFFNASQKETDISVYKNIFVKVSRTSGSSIKISFSDGATRRPTVIRLDSGNKKIAEQFIADSNKRKAFLDYRALLKIHLIDLDDVNLFDLLIENLLHFSVNPITGKPLGVHWAQLKSVKIDKRTKEYEQLVKDLEDFSSGLKQLLRVLEKEANEIINEFKYNLKIHLSFRKLTITDENEIGGKTIKLGIDFFDKKDIPKHHHFLNEARLTAISIAIYLGSILNIPSAMEYKILVLDDIFIGLDTSNRMPLLEILKSKFSDYQIFISTYDRQWYEMAKLCTKDSEWVYSEMYVKEEPENGYEFPIYCDQTDFLDKAEKFLNDGDLKASAVYVRSAFERELSKHCDKKGIPVKFTLNPSKLNVEDLWSSVKDRTITKRDTNGNPTQERIITEDLRDRVSNQRTLVMNPYSHFDINKPQFKTELRTTIDIIKELKTVLK